MANLFTSSESSLVKKRGYKVLETIGEGAYAKVVAAEYTIKNEQNEMIVMKLACKVIDKKVAPAEFVKKFLPRELEILSKLSHPHIIHVHSIFQKNAKYFLFMRLAELGDLLSYILKKGELSENHSKFWLRQIALGLQYLHIMDICHRDLKLENIFITRNMNVKLGDFGFARSTVDFKGNPLLSETYCGSLSYAAPEIIKGLPYDPKLSDVWSLGCVLFAMLNQRMPFEDNTMPKLYELQMNRKVKYRSNVLNQLSSAVKLLIYHMLEPAVLKRYDINAVCSCEWFQNIQMTPTEKQALERAYDTKRKAVEMARRTSISKLFAQPKIAREELRKTIVVIKEVDTTNVKEESLYNQNIAREVTNVSKGDNKEKSLTSAGVQTGVPTRPFSPHFKRS